MKAIKLLATKNFDLRECLSNSPKINDYLKSLGKLNQKKNISVLGLNWNSETDEISFKPLEPIKGPLTKRNILRFAASLYDPLGLLVYATAPCMAFLTKLWALKYDWDTEISSDLQNEWQRLEALAIGASKTTFPRFHQFDPAKEMNLWVFADASDDLGAALGYLQQGEKVVLVGGKFKIFNKNENLTTPRKELLALDTASKLGKDLMDTFSTVYPKLKGHLCSDSEICLHWLSSTKKLETFVQNRKINILQRLTNWSLYHCASEMNPADLPSRALAPETAHDARLYYEGPVWLRKNCPPDPWKKSVKQQPELITLASMVDNTPEPSLNCLLEPEKFNDLGKLIRLTALLLKPFFKGKDAIWLEKEAFLRWILLTQETFFPVELKFLRAGGKPPSMVTALRLFLATDKLIRCRGRFENVDAPFSEKFPMLLPKKAHFTWLIMMDTHKKLKHAGVQQLIASIRRQFWIPQIKGLTQKIIKRCVPCQKVQGKSYNVPLPPSLPADRVNLVKPYETVGVDFTGAIHFVENGTIAKGYILIISCTVTRHVHLLLVRDMSAKTFIQTLRYHAAIYGKMSKVLCDNALGFVSADEQLQEIVALINRQEVESHFKEQRIKFEFIPKRSPWFGAHYERLIGVLKGHLKKSVGKSLLEYSELQLCLAGNWPDY